MSVFSVPCQIQPFSLWLWFVLLKLPQQSAPVPLKCNWNQTEGTFLRVKSVSLLLRPWEAFPGNLPAEPTTGETGSRPSVDTFCLQLIVRRLIYLIS